MSEQFNQEAMKKITNNYKFVSTFVVCFISCATALFHYANQLMLMGYLEFFGYSLDIVKSNVFEILGIVFEVVKLCAFVVIVQVLGWYAIKYYQDIKRAIFRILTSLKRYRRVKKANLDNQDIKTIGYVLLFSFYLLCAWLALQFTGHLIAVGLHRSLRMFGYTEGMTDIEVNLFWIFSTWRVSVSMISELDISYGQALIMKYTICIAPYVPALVYLLFQKIRSSDLALAKLVYILVSILCVAALYNLLDYNISGTLYLMGQQRAERDEYFDTVVVDDDLYVVAYETDTYLYLTKCEYTDEGECLHIDTDYRLCLNRVGVLIEGFPVYGSVESNTRMPDFD